MEVDLFYMGVEKLSLLAHDYLQSEIPICLHQDKRLGYMPTYVLYLGITSIKKLKTNS
jgi:hypothetical protein